MNKKPKTNTICIIGFILSIPTCILGLITCILGKENAKEQGEKGRGLANTGIIISLLKIIFIIVLFILFSLDTDAPTDEEICKTATNCVQEEYGYKTCTYEDMDGVEKYVSCPIEENVVNGTLEEDEETKDTTDYDKEY